jgi:hypothetical protein
MTGELLINGVDVYTTYGVTPLKGTFEELLKPVPAKPPLTVEIDTLHGEDVFFQAVPKLSARSFTLPLAIVASNAANFFTKKDAFETFLRVGLFTVSCPKITGKTFRCYFEDCTQYNQLEPITNKRVSAIIQLKLREPNPSVR